ncbi:OsmC family protein [Liquorilactobacillus cacaonum]|uniref:OsmC family protein n=1 Tax=Liquorilactobacillus cacaonum DSM 21116 TaxID=1423729 RepID=A0A0R2CT66_9LACO|nr:OsmC family protein [Liquorilactobacillus cacaonum]KRM90835.1 OsmC family protein [Liquorilactobacillus cacaonum DSM 21116]
MGKYIVNSSIRNIGYQVGAQAGVHRYLMDEPTTVRGTDAGPNPVQYLIGAVNGCLTITAQSVAKKHRIKLEKFDIKSIGNVAKHDDGTSEVDEIAVNITFRADIEGKDKEDFIEETLAQCTVHKTLEAGVKFTFNFEQE